MHQTGSDEDYWRTKHRSRFKRLNTGRPRGLEARHLRRRWRRCTEFRDGKNWMVLAKLAWDRPDRMARPATPALRRLPRSTPTPGALRRAALYGLLSFMSS